MVLSRQVTRAEKDIIRGCAKLVLVVNFLVVFFVGYFVQLMLFSLFLLCTMCHQVEDAKTILALVKLFAVSQTLLIFQKRFPISKKISRCKK